jgi:hypothetical protein
MPNGTTTAVVSPWANEVSSPKTLARLAPLQSRFDRLALFRGATHHAELGAFAKLLRALWVAPDIAGALFPSHWHASKLGVDSLKRATTLRCKLDEAELVF